MIRHIVMWKLKENAEGVSKAVNVEKMRTLLEGMEDTIPHILSLEVGMNVSSPDATHDIVLSTEFRNLAYLGAYREHPEHKKVDAFVRKVMVERAVVDYII